MRQCSHAIQSSRQRQNEAGIVRILPTRGGQPALGRLLHLLHTTSGTDWNPSTLTGFMSLSGTTLIGDRLRYRFFDRRCTVPRQQALALRARDGCSPDGLDARDNDRKIAADADKDRRFAASPGNSYPGTPINGRRMTSEITDPVQAVAPRPDPKEHRRSPPLSVKDPSWNNSSTGSPKSNEGVRSDTCPVPARDLPGRRRASTPCASGRMSAGRTMAARSARSTRQGCPGPARARRLTDERVTHISPAIARKAR